MKGEEARSGARLVPREALLVLAVLALVVIVAIAAAAGAPGGGEGAPRGSAPSFLVEYAATIAVVMLPIGALLIVWALVMRRIEQARGGVTRRRSVLRTVILTALVVTAAVIASNEIRERFENRGVTPGVPSTASSGEPGGISRRDREERAQFQWPAVIVIGSLAFAFVAVAAGFAIRRRLRRPEEPAALAAALSDVFDETLDDLRQEPDPRKAVIRTYDRMERTLAARGLPRHAFEAPLEYLSRVLAVLGVGTHSGRRLTRLFERARFSSHEIDPGMKEDAIEALVGLRAELETVR
jgi:hypothetical protein